LKLAISSSLLPQLAEMAVSAPLSFRLLCHWQRETLKQLTPSR